MRVPRTVTVSATKQFYIFLNLFVDSANCSKLHIDCCWLRKLACFCSDFERYSVSFICLWNPKQKGKSKKSSIVVDSATNLILAVAESYFISQNSQFGLVMERLNFITKPVYMALKPYECSFLTNFSKKYFKHSLAFQNLLFQPIITSHYEKMRGFFAAIHEEQICSE